MARNAPRLRWDRIGRLALLFVALLLIGLWVRPLLTLVSTQREAQSKRGQVAELQREHRDLLRRQSALRRAGSVELEARRLGMVRPSERAYVVKGLPRGE